MAEHWRRSMQRPARSNSRNAASELQSGLAHGEINCIRDTNGARVLDLGAPPGEGCIGLSCGFWYGQRLGQYRTPPRAALVGCAQRYQTQATVFVGDAAFRPGCTLHQEYD
eukprot:2562383-Rhodomonas_salina.1